MYRIVRVLCCLLALSCGIAAASPAANLYAKPGERFEVGHHWLNLVCVGSGRPVVVLDAGLGDWSPAWIPIQRPLSPLTTVCAYDRAGYGFSQAARGPRTSMEIARELHALLIASKLPGPYVLVGHSFGGLNQQAFTELYRPEVAGLVLVDSTPDDLRDPPFLHQLYAGELASGRQCAALAERGAFHANTLAFDGCFQWLFGITTLPNNGVTPALIAAVKQQARHPAPYLAHLSELENPFSTSESEVRAHMHPFGALPMIVLTATSHGENQLSGALRKDMLAFEPQWRLAQDRLASHSTCMRHEIVKSDHYIQFYRPHVVIGAIREVVSAVRRGSSRCAFR